MQETNLENTAEYLAGKVHGLETLKAAFIAVYWIPRARASDPNDVLAAITELRIAALGTFYEEVGEVGPDDLFLKGVEDVFANFIQELHWL